MRNTYAAANADVRASRAANIFEQEARDIVRYFERHGYAARVDGARSEVVVLDPVWVLPTGESAGRHEHKEVRLNGWDAAIRFVAARS